MNRTGIFIGIAVLVLAIAVVASSMIIAPVLADDDDDGDRVFTNESIKGRWGFLAQGTVLPPAVPAATPAAAVGILYFDGVGGCTLTDTFNIGGTTFGPLTSETCTYSVNPDGTGTWSFAFPGDLEPTPLSFVIVNDMQEIVDVRTDSFAVAFGVIKRQ